MTRIVYHEELEKLNGDLLSLFDGVRSALVDSVDSLVGADTSMAKMVIERDKELNRLKLNIEDRCIKLLALQQPMGPDLRFIATALKIITDLDRMADRSCHIAEIHEIIQHRPADKISKKILEMREKCLEMFDRVFQCFRDKDRDALEELSDMDDIVDNYQEEIFRMIIDHMRKNPDEMKSYVYILLVPRHLERIADHSTNIASRIIYMIDGERVWIH